MTTDLTFNEVSAINAERCAIWHAPGGAWSLADWGNAMGGECGEAQNVIKKIRRRETGLRGAKDPDMDVLMADLADELADTFCYLDLVATNAGINLADAIVRKFNRISDREGFPQRLRED